MWQLVLFRETPRARAAVLIAFEFPQISPSSQICANRRNNERHPES
jgi:hypothetical protein